MSPTSYRAHTRTLITAPDGARLATYTLAPADAGRTTPTVVLAHGWTLSHEGWAHVAKRLVAAGARVVMWDQRGHGRSTLSGGRHRATTESVRALGDDLQLVMRKAVPPESPLVLAGHSMGGMTVMAYAGLHPDELVSRVRGVVLVSTAMGGLRGPGLPMEAQVMRALGRVQLRQWPMSTVRGHRRNLFGDDPRPEDLRAARYITSRTRLSIVGSYYGALMQHDESEAMESLGRVPVDVLVGSKDRLTPPRLSARLEAAIPGARLTTYEGAGHMLPFERAAEVAAVITTHLP